MWNEHCKVNAISHFCINCDQWICNICSTIHPNMSATKHHQIKNLSQKTNEFKTQLRCESIKLEQVLQLYKDAVVTCQKQAGNTEYLQLKLLKDSKKKKKKLHREIYECFLSTNLQGYRQYNQNIYKPDKRSSGQMSQTTRNHGKHSTGDRITYTRENGESLGKCYHIG